MIRYNQDLGSVRYLKSVQALLLVRFYGIVIIVGMSIAAFVSVLLLDPL